MSFFNNAKPIDVRLIAPKALLVQILKLINMIQYSLDNNKGEETVITIRIKNKHRVKLLSAVNSDNLSPVAHNNEIIIGE